jgi:hypothetical protein
MAKPPRRELCTWPDGCKFPRLKAGRFCGKHSALVLARLRDSRDYRPDEGADRPGRAWLRAQADHV